MDIDVAIQLQHALLWAREDIDSKDTDKVLALAARYQEFLSIDGLADEPMKESQS